MIVKEIPYFNLKQIADSGQCFRWKRLGDDKYRIIAYGRCLEAMQDGEKILDGATDDILYQVGALEQAGMIIPVGVKMLYTLRKNSLLSVKKVTRKMDVFEELLQLQ